MFETSNFGCEMALRTKMEPITLRYHLKSEKTRKKRSGNYLGTDLCFKSIIIQVRLDKKRVPIPIIAVYF